MYWAKTVDIVYPDGYVKAFTYLMCDSFEEFTTDTAGVVGAQCLWEAQAGQLPKAEAREIAKNEFKLLKWRKNPVLSPDVISAMNELGAVISTTLLKDIYGTGDEKGIRETREMIINRKIENEFYYAMVYIPGYESIFDGTLNKSTQRMYESDSACVYAYCDIARAYYENRDYDRAIENYSQVLKIAPDYFPAYYHRGGNFYMKGDYECAAADLAEYIKIDPDNETVKGLFYKALIKRKNISPGQ
jgi:tetratricopeptide (TPR) repeat protein